MTDSSPGSKYPAAKPSLAPIKTDSSSGSSQPSSLPMADDRFGSSDSRTVISHPLDGSSDISTFEYHNALQFRLRSASDKRCPSFTYTTPPGVVATPLEWKMCCEPGSDIPSEHVTYHQLSASDESLTAVVDEYITTESNIIGLIVINSTASRYLSENILDKTTPPQLPVYVVSLEDGTQIEGFVSQQKEGDVQVKVLVESTVDALPVGLPVQVPAAASTGPSPPPVTTQPKAAISKPVTYSLTDELKRVLYVGRKERVHACADRPVFQFLFSCFHNYEIAQKKDSPDKAIKTLDNFTDDSFTKDFPFYLLLGYRFILYNEVYGGPHSDAVNGYLVHCMEKFEILDAECITSVLFSFMQRGDFLVQFDHVQQSDVSVFKLLYLMAGVMLEKSNKLQGLKEKNTKVNFVGVYRRMLWITLRIFFGLHLKVDHTKLVSLWESELLNEWVLKGLTFSEDVVKEFAYGFELCRSLKLSENVCIDQSTFAIFLNPLKLKNLHMVHIIQLLNASEAYLPWDTMQLLCHFLPPMRANYMSLFENIKKDWRRFSKEGTKLGGYKEVLRFLEYTYGLLAKLSLPDGEKSRVTEVVHTEIQKWLEMLLDHVDIRAGDAVNYFILLRQELRPVQLSKMFKGTINTRIKKRGMDAVKGLPMAQFFTLFKELQMWPFEFVEKFLNNYVVPISMDLKDPSWKLLLEEIVYRFSDTNCKKCIVSLIKRVGEAYKSGRKQNNFVIDLMKLDIPNLLVVESPKQDDPNVEQLFIDMIHSFVQRNALRDSLMGQIATIMKPVTASSHFQGLVLTAIQKEIVPDTRMIEKLNSSHNLKLLVVNGVDHVIKTLNSLHQLSGVDKFYWHFIASCCSHIQPDADNLDRIAMYTYAVEKLAKIFQEYCIAKNIGAQVFHVVPEGINQLSNNDVKDYFKWVVKMQSIITHWQSKFLSDEFNYDDIFVYAGNLLNISRFAAAVNAGNLVYKTDEISKIKETYSSLYSELCVLMVKSIKDTGWCTLVDMLLSYGVRLDHSLQAKLDAHVILPGRRSTVDPSDIQQGLSQPNGQLDLEPEIIVMLHKSTTLKILKELDLDLQNFLHPILKQLEFLVYFHLHNCEMFSKYLKSQIDKLSTPVVDESDIALTFPSRTKRHSPPEPNDQLERFSSALDGTKEFILSLIRGTAKYKEIFAEGTMEESLQKFDAESEFKIMCGFPGFKEASSANEEGKQGIKNMLELFQYSQQISIIPDVCAQYHMQKCLDDPKIEELKVIANSCKNAEDRAKITGQIASNHMKSIWKILNFEGSKTDSTAASSENSVLAKKCLKIFPAVANCAEFYQFIKGKGFTTDTGRSAFRSQVQLITAQLQHEDYNETVLNHLTPAFAYITPFLDTEQTLAELMGKIVNLFKDGVGFGRDPRKDFCQLETVNSNITMIQLWFSRTEGDTLENVAKELDCIMNTGKFELVICRKRIAGHSQTDEATAGCTSEVLLHYQPMKELYHRKFRQSVLNDSGPQEVDGSVPMSPVILERQHSCIQETWDNEQIEDFVRKLGFLEAQSAVEQRVKRFQQLNQTAQKFYHILLKLRDLGHPFYLQTQQNIPCSSELERAEKMVNNAEDILKDWRTKIKALHRSYDKLLFFSVSKVLSLYDILKSWTFDSVEMVQEIGFLFENSPSSIEKLKKAVERCRETDPDSDNLMSFSNEMPVAHVGKYLERLCRDFSINEHFLYSRSQAIASFKGKSLLSFQEIVHFAPNYDNGQLLRLLIEIYNGVPESYEVFHCSEDSTEEDLRLFLHRASTFSHRTFTILEVNQLPYKLQELILHHHSQEAQILESCTRLNYIETASSVLHEMPWVIVKEYKDNGPNLSWDKAKKTFDKYVNKGNSDFHLELVYGCAGDGKTHYIRQQLDDPHLVIAVNESFTPLNAILKLRKLPHNHTCAVFFNFTIVPSIKQSTPEEESKYAKLMNTLAWFFFKLLVFGYVEDLETGMAFRLPGGLTWRIYIEVPSHSDNVKHNLEWFCNNIPIFHLLGIPTLIDKDKSYDVDNGVQLVCKYLNAYENRGANKGINRLYSELAPAVLIKFGEDPDLPEELCHKLLKKYMPSHVTTSKVLQRLFIRYMERRCNFLERFPAFNFNSGCGTLFNDKQASPSAIKDMVNNSIIVKLRGRYYSNTAHLGQVLMETMLQEVSEFCKIDVQQNWATQAHQQLIYESDEGAGTIQLITLKPEDLDPHKTKQFEVLGIEIPTIKELLDRKKLDFYLSSALGVPLKEGKLQDIDDSHYVLTLDYTIKMLNIHERRECGIPVIIEGETGVGKTALINMLSKLWNHALINEWRMLKARIIETLYLKSLDHDSNLKSILKQFESTDQQLDKHLDAPDKYITEEDITPLLEMDHSLSQGDDMPYYQFINRHILQLVKSVNILEMLDVDVETPPDNLNQSQTRLRSTSVKEKSVVKEMVRTSMDNPSPQSTAKLICSLLNGNLVTTFHKLNIHAALTPKEIHEFFIPIINLANYLKRVHNSKKLKDTPVVTVFLDELNTSSCMGLFKEMIIDRNFEGEPLPSNIFLVAACNPHRGNSLAIHENKDEHKAETWVRGAYYVQKLHPTLRFLMWDYGSLNKDQESAYVKAKMIMVNDDFGIVQNIAFSELVVRCQELIREFAFDQLKKFGVDKEEAILRATSSVSQRDIQRVFTFYSWIVKTYEALQTPVSEGLAASTMAMGDMPAACITKHPMISEELDPAEMKQRALLVALGLVYYMRLDSKYRTMFANELDKMIPGVKFLTAFTEEMDFYINELSLPAGIAKTEALKENLFATIICTVTNTPLIIVGAPGSSKTLSFNLTVSNLKGPESKHQLFRNTEVFKSLDPHYYQCSRRTTSTEIETVFQRAINRQRSHKSFSMPIRCVVFMDEAGLPEESHESLKVLHYHLDQQEVAFVAITNHILDAAKTNRAVSLFRPTASQKDLETLAKGCLCTNPDKPPAEFRHALETIVKFCPAYNQVMKDKRLEKFFGLRDFIHFINYIRRHHQGDMSPQLVLESLERNFNGAVNAVGFEEICKIFFDKVGYNLDTLKKKRTIIDILRSSLDDKPYSNKSAQMGLQRKPNKILPGDKYREHDTQNEVRYKLIIDPSEDESVTQLLFMFDILKRENTRTYMCSDFPGDGQLQKINTIAAIRHSAIEGHTVIMSQTDDIHESFYDLFNQHFRRIDDPEHGPRYFTNIAIGAHLKPSRVDQEFQCIVVIKESEIKNTPAPFLNRFEKYFISHKNLLNLVLDALPPCLKVVVKVVATKVEEFYSVLGEGTFYGGNKETVCSLLLGILPKPGHKYEIQSQSFVPVSEDDTDGTSTTQLGASFVVTPQSSSRKTLLLQILVKCLHELGGFCYMGEKPEELEHDASRIINLLAVAGSEFGGVAEELENCEPDAISQWVAEALDLVYTGAAPPDIDTIDFDTCEEDQFKTLGASDGACMVTALIAQWLVRFMCKKLMQLMTPEAAILKRKSIPISYLETYLNFQTHFNIKELITKHVHMLHTSAENKVANKLICYTRSSSSIHQLPAVYPRSALSTAEEFERSEQLIEKIIYEKAEDLLLCKLSSISSQTAFKLQLQSFSDSPQQTVFVLIINMQETSRQIVNHIRIIIEEAEHVTEKSNKLFVLLLHFPAMMFYDPCYPSLFLPGWDHYYLDTIDQTYNSSLVDTKEWFRQSCLSAKESRDTPDDPMCKELLAVLNEPESIQIIASRILLNVDSNELSLESLPDITTKSNYLKRLLTEKKVGIVLCLKFKSYWKPSVMGDHLEQAAKFARSRESTLNITDSVDSMYKAAFFNFIAYMIYQMSKSHGLELLFGTHCDDATLDLFLKLLDVYPIPKLSEIKAFNNTWDCRVHSVSKAGYTSQFPFFKEVSTYITNMIEQNVAEVNENIDILQDNAGSESAAGSQDKEHMLKRLYEYVCDKTSATIKGEKVAGEKYMSAVAIKEMQNDESMWQKYYNDFTNYFLHMSSAPNSIEHQLLQLTFDDVLHSYKEMKAIAAHCYIHLYQLDLAKVVALLKPLGQLHIVRDDQASLYPENPEYTFVSTLQASKAIPGSKDISKFVIESLFAVLINAVYSKGDRMSQLQQWYTSYRDMMSMTTLKNILNTKLTEKSKAQCRLMEITFLVLQSFDEITELAEHCASVFTNYMCNRFFTDKFEFKTEVPLNLHQTMECFNVMMQSPQFEEVVKKQLHHHILEGLISHFFPEIGSSTSLYCKEDIEYFVSFANKQKKWKHSVQKDHVAESSDLQLDSCISLSKFKFHLDKILCKGWSKNGKASKPINLYKLEVCTCIGNTILWECPGATPSEYIPPYLQQTQGSKNPLMQQMLTHLYFYTVLEKLQTCQYSPSNLVAMINTIDKKLKEVDNDAERLVLFVERQALIEVTLQSIAINFEIDNKIIMKRLLAISDEINVLIKDQSHCDILLMLLIRKHHGPHGVLRLLSEQNKKWWGNFECFKSIREQLKSSPPPTSHLFPFVVGSPNAKQQFTTMYREVCNHLHSMGKGYNEEKVKKFLNFANSFNVVSYDANRCIRMMLWLGVYHEFYCHKKPGLELIRSFESAQDKLNLSSEHLNVLRCFLDPTKMIKEEEVANPLNPNTEMLEVTREGQVKRRKPPSNAPKKDAVWEFFNFQKNEDPSDTDLRHALANMIAVVFALPSRSNHIWYHMFCPGELNDTFMTGFMYRNTVKKGGLMYDCGCELNEDGQYGRKDYIPHATRGTLSLHSWYLMLWTNFGAFCVGLLTQPNAMKQINGQILSDWMSIRDYCMTQLRTVWLHMRTNFVFGDDERSFFIMRSMHMLFMLDNNFPCPQGKFTDLDSVNAYEKAWHRQIYEPAKANLQAELENHSSHSVWALPVLKNFRMLDQHYPHLVTENDYMKSLVTARETCNFNPTYLFALHHFTLEYERLQVGGALLPDLVEFYQWIHTYLSHLVSYERAKQITIGNVINLSTKRYTQDICDHLTELLKRIIERYNNYLKVSGGVVGDATCNKALKATDVHRISEETPLIRLVSLEDTSKNDWLYLVLMDIIGSHNSFLNSIFSHATHSYQKYLPDSPPESHPTEVTSQSCIVPSDGDTGKHQFLKLIKSCYVYNGVKSSPMFDLDQLEQNVVAFYIAGKPRIQLDSVRTIFRFRNSPNETTLGNNPGCAIDLSAIAQELPNKYKESMKEETRRTFEYHFRTTTYHSFTEIVTGLRTVMGHLVQDILRNQDKAWDATLNVKLIDYLKKFYNKEQKLFEEIGIQSINDTQVKLLGDIEMKRLFKCMGLFVGWLQGGLYDFSSLPISVFTHLEREDMETLGKIPTKYSAAGLDQLLRELDEFEKSLNHAELHLTTQAEQRKSMVEILIDLVMCDPEDKFVGLLPKTILVCHYIQFRMALRKLKIKVTGMAHVQTQSATTAVKKWTEIIEDLWKHLPHFQDEEELYDDNCLKFDCVNLQFGDGEESDSDSETWLHHNTSDMEESLVEVDETKRKMSQDDLLQKLEENPDLKKALLQTLATTATSTASVSPLSGPAASVSPSLVVLPSQGAMNMTHEQLCDWLKEKKIAGKYLQLFEEDESIDGGELATYTEQDLEELGISESRIRKKILHHFRQIK